MGEKTKKLCEIVSGKLVQVHSVSGGGAIKRRLLELGFVPNAVLKVLNVSPFGKAFLIDCVGSVVALRLNVAGLINVVEILGE